MPCGWIILHLHYIDNIRLDETLQVLQMVLDTFSDKQEASHTRCPTSGEDSREAYSRVIYVSKVSIQAQWQSIPPWPPRSEDFDLFGMQRIMSNSMARLSSLLSMMYIIYTFLLHRRDSTVRLRLLSAREYLYINSTAQQTCAWLP